MAARVSTHFLLWLVGLAKPETQTSDAERACLAKHVKDRKRVVEIGCWHGVSTCLLRQAMAPDGQLWGVDPYSPGRFGFSLPRIVAAHEVAGVQRGTMHWLRLTGAAAGRAWPGLSKEPVEFLFVDGDHSYEGLREDWLAWKDKLAPGGIAAFHDSHFVSGRIPEDAGSLRCMNEMILKDPGFAVLEVVETLTVLVCRPD